MEKHGSKKRGTKNAESKNKERNDTEVKNKEMDALQNKRLVIVTGMSGAGKTVALKALEDIGFYCVDNLPVFLLEPFAKLLSEAGDKYKLAAVGIDIRSGENLGGLQGVLEQLAQEGNRPSVLFLDASDRVLVKRFKETRRKHPLAQDGRPEDGIRKEREVLASIKEGATYVIDTSRLLTKDLRLQLEKMFSGRTEYSNLYLTVLSFGFKYGIPEDADYVFDVRFLPNPYYVDELKAKTGLDEAVRAYCLQTADGPAFVGELCGFMDFVIPRFLADGRNQLVVAVGCTGGKHRSVTIAEALYRHLQGKKGLGVNIEHRDIVR